MKSALERHREKVEERLAEAAPAAAEHLARILDPASEDGDRPWKASTVRDHVALAFAGYEAARQRARINANAAPKVFGLVVMPPRIEDPKEWEAKARAAGNRIIDTTAGPALPAKEPEGE